MTLMIKIGSAYKYLRENGNLPDQELDLTVVAARYKIKRLIKLGLVIGDANQVDIKSLKDYLEYESNIFENYISIREFVSLLGIKTTKDSIRQVKRKLNKLERNSPFECICMEYANQYQTFFIGKLSVVKFFKNYTPLEKLKSRYDYTYQGWYDNFRKLGINPLSLGYDKSFITNLEYELLVNFLESTKIFINNNNNNKITSHDASANGKSQSGNSKLGKHLSEYYTLDESKQILSVKRVIHFSKIIKDYKLQSFMTKDGRKYFKKEDIDKLKHLQTDLREKYISLSDAREQANSEGINFYSDYIKSEQVDSLVRPFFKGRSRMYLKETFNNWLEERRTSIEFFSVSMESDFQTFLHRLKIKEIDINKLGPFTTETWFQYISSKLRKSKANPQTKDIDINQYVYCTETLITLVSSTKKQEIYSLKANDINLLFNKIPKRYRIIIYLYLKAVHGQLDLKKVKAYDFNRINDPHKFDTKHRDKSIYEYEVYKKIYNYSKDIPLHKDRSIKDVLKEITTVGKRSSSKYYATSWLYVLLHLNNAWRHSDVITFPQVNLSGTQITDLKWMLKNELSDEDADYIIKQVYRAEFIISKTQVKNYFFCSEELKKPFATAIAICQLRINALYPLRESIIDFGNKNQRFSNSRRRNFFELYEDKEFHFSSRKMNRSLLSYIYVLLSKMKNGNAGLKTIQKMRGHLEKETTNIYVEIPAEELNFLTRQLFARGSFGFIYDTFLDVLQGIEIDREKRTTEIQFLDNYFGGVDKIEEISNFLNVIQSDRKAILDRILSMGLDEALDFVNKIGTNQLPSKRDNVQCLVAESACVKKGQGVDCFDCAYSIPNYYALSALGVSLQDRLDSFVESQKSEANITYYEQRKRARLFYIQLEMFAQAIQRFGMDVYEFITDSREEFKAKQTKIDSLEERYQLT
ncbi:hypothetical protein DZB84_14295 [Bacillus sp. HNG]|uniref:hypothetical protein n=1 Tax=Bacillus sp. HNG TaxID=2293325 RepID=UPI000E2FF326|nr:hypothetical protein [Bacillus sp. HNG]RFB15073.1 hypothetical protein DZB84_14295 [Bacillus sp. HNG]